MPNVPSIKEDPGHEPRHESPDGPRRPRADALWMANDHGATAAHSGNQIQNQVAQSPPHCFLDSADDEQRNHIEAEMHETEVDEAARQQPPPLPIEDVLAGKGTAILQNVKHLHSLLRIAGKTIQVDAHRNVSLHGQHQTGHEHRRVEKQQKARDQRLAPKDKGVAHNFAALPGAAARLCMP